MTTRAALGAAVGAAVVAIVASAIAAVEVALQAHEGRRHARHRERPPLRLAREALAAPEPQGPFTADDHRRRERPRAVGARRQRHGVHQRSPDTGTAFAGIDQGQPDDPLPRMRVAAQHVRVPEQASAPVRPEEDLVGARVADWHVVEAVLQRGRCRRRVTDFVEEVGRAQPQVVHLGQIGLGQRQ